MATSNGCVASKFPFTYLGLPVGKNMARVEDWSDVIHKVTCKLSNWIFKTLYVRGILNLLKSVLGALPTYFFVSF